MKRHSAEEISSKLRKAIDLTKNGLSQAQACKELCVSVMTLHRWRKRYDAEALTTRPIATKIEISTLLFDDDNVNNRRVAELRIENDRLRRIAVNLLLDRIEAEKNFNAF